MYTNSDNSAASPADFWGGAETPKCQMTVPHHADNYSSMNKSAPFVKVLVFAAYMLAMLVPGWTMVGEQTQAEHAQMMAMAGHEMTMADMGSDMGSGQNMGVIFVVAARAKVSSLRVGLPWTYGLQSKLPSTTGRSALISLTAFHDPTG